MSRCTGITQAGRRCKRRILEPDEAFRYCSVHADMPGMPTEVDREYIPDTIWCFKDGDSSERVCGHCCMLTLDKCCECTDARPADAEPLHMRHRGYCAKCKERCTKNLPAELAVPRTLRNFVQFDVRNIPDRLPGERLVIAENDRLAILLQIVRHALG
jgi:hypothetical protein